MTDLARIGKVTNRTRVNTAMTSKLKKRRLALFNNTNKENNENYKDTLPQYLDCGADIYSNCFGLWHSIN